MNLQSTPLELKTSKAFYVAPETEAVEVRSEGVICGSGGSEDYTRNPEQNW